MCIRDRDFVQKVKEFIVYLRPMLKEYHEVFTGNVIAQERLKVVGAVSYTHLDVYKRQRYSDTKTQCSIVPGPRWIGRRRRSYSCLLYTSRCV